MNICDVRVLGPLVAKTRVPRAVQCRECNEFDRHGWSASASQAGGLDELLRQAHSLLNSLTGSSCMRAFLYLALRAGSPASPNWQINYEERRVSIGDCLAVSKRVVTGEEAAAVIHWEQP